jgi:hypothetical protein
MLGKNSRFKLIEAMPDLFYLDGYSVESETALWAKILDFDAASKDKGIITVASNPPHEALKYAFNFDSKDGKVGKSIIEQINEIKAEEGPKNFKLKIKIGTL